MLKTAKKWSYKAFELTILSEIALPELHPITKHQEGRFDIEVQISDLSALWSCLSSEQKRFIVKDDKILFMVPGTAIFCIQGGIQIIVSPMMGSEEDKIRLYILGTCMGALLLQRKVLPLHGSAVEINGKAYAFIGDSGAGKSTLASAFLNRGFNLLSDDVIAVSFSPENIPMVMPSYPQQKLWDESLTQFGMERKDYKPLFERETKYSVPVTSKFFGNPLPLAGVFELGKTDQENIQLYHVKGIQRLQILYRQTFRNFLVPQLSLMEWHFHISSSMVKHIDVFQLLRPTTGFTAPQLTTFILNSIRKGEK